MRSRIAPATSALSVVRSTATPIESTAVRAIANTRGPSTARFASWPVRMLQRVVDGPLVRASASSPELARNPHTEGARGESREGTPSPASDAAAVMEARRPSRFTTQVRLHRHDPARILAIALLVLLAYVPILRREIDRGLEDDTVKVLIAIVFIVGAVLLWGRWTDAFWMWR